jgi:DeoR/GlpR family transcriptional regulator of sugar metabolism
MSFKTFNLAHDVASVVSAINEVVSISSSIYTNDLNVQRFNNIASASAVPLGGYWETAYDTAYGGANATALFDVSFGYASSSAFNTPASVTSSQNEKIKIYRMMANSLWGSADQTSASSSSSSVGS